MTTDNAKFNELVKFVDYELNDALTDDQKDKIYHLAADLIELEDRITTVTERAEAALSAARMEKLPIRGEPIQEYGFKWWVNHHQRSIALTLAVIVTLIVVSFI